MTVMIQRSSIDIFEDSVLVNPWPVYRQLQEQGALVWFDRLNAAAVTATRSAGISFVCLTSLSRGKVLV